MPTLQRSPSIAVLTSLNHPARISLEGVRAQSPRPIEQEWESLQARGTTAITMPPHATTPTSTFELAQMFGPKVSIICRSEGEPTDAAMALLWNFSGSASISMVSNTQPAHLLRYIPEDFDFTPSRKPLPASSQFLITPSNLDVRAAARAAPPQGTIVVVDTIDHEAARHLALLGSLRSDLTLVGCTAALPDGPHQLHPNAIGMDAFDRTANLRAGGSSFVAGVLSRRDAAWINQTTASTLKAGDVMFAPFGAQGIDRTLFSRWQQEMPQRVQECIELAVKPHIELLPLALIAPPSVDSNPGLRNLRHAIRKLGPTVVFGATGNIGSAIVEALGGKIPVHAISRQGSSEALNRLGSPEHPVRQCAALPAGAAVSTVFLTASVPWLRCPRTNRIIFDRTALLEDNLQNVLIPQLRQIPPETKVVQIITNPSSDLTYAAWLLRPDLAHAVSAHVGTDIVRQHAHVSQPNQPETWFTFGPHSPAQVNVDLAAGTIDPAIAVMGKTLNDEAGDRSVIDPTGLSSIVEAARLHTNQASCYGLPLSAQEAFALSEFMDREMGRPVVVSEGIAPTLPRDGQRRIRWDMLRKAGSVLGFPDLALRALQEMETGRQQVIAALVQRVRARHPHPETIDANWILQNRETLLTI